MIMDDNLVQNRGLFLMIMDDNLVQNRGLS